MTTMSSHFKGYKYFLLNITSYLTKNLTVKMKFMNHEQPKMPRLVLYHGVPCFSITCTSTWSLFMSRWCRFQD